MKRLAIFTALALTFAIVAPTARAQDDRNHGEFGVFFDYTRLQFAKANLFGVGGRVGFNIRPAVALEGEMAYDFERSQTATITSNGITNTTRSNLRLIHGLFGPKFETTRGQFRRFVSDATYTTEAESGDGAYGWDPEKKEFTKKKDYNWRNVGFDQTDEHPIARFGSKPYT